MSLQAIKKAIILDPDNAWAKEKGWEPIYTAHSDARILLVGQAPGIRAQESGLPFNDPSGDNLRSWLGVTRETFYDETKFALVPMDFYYPGKLERGDVPPRKDFALKWHPKILAELPNIKLTILVGQYSQAYYLGNRRKQSLTETVRNFSEYLPDYFPLVHPSPRNFHWHQKNPWFKEEVVPVLRETVVKILE